jgi:glucose/arabinose dehydrogenase
MRLLLGVSLVVFACALLSACDDVDEPSRSSDPSAQDQGLAGDTYASTASSLPTPEPAVTQVPRLLPATTTDESPRRVSASASSKIELDLGGGWFTPSVLRQTVVRGLVAPTDMAFSNEGILFYTERLQGLFAQRPGQSPALLYLPKDLGASGSLGMLSVALDPAFSRNHMVYVFVKGGATGTGEIRVTRLALDNVCATVLDRRDIFLASESLPVDANGRRDSQAGGGLRFGPEGFLYIGLGDGRVATAPQSPTQLAGKVLRVDRDGIAARGNRPPAGYDGRIYAYGVRDPVALTFHPNTETLLIAQRRGPQADDLIWAQSGMNAGWDPRCSNPTLGYCEPSSPTGRPSSNVEGGWRGGKAGEGVTAVERLRGAMWGTWRNAFLVAFDKAQRLDVVKFDSQGRVVKSMPVVQKLGVGFKALAQGPDALYVMTSGKSGGEEIWRVTVQ